MSVQQEHATSETATLTTTESGGVYQSLFDKINLTPVSSIQEIDLWQNSETLADASPDERVTAAIHVLLSCLAKSGENVVKLDKSLLDFHIDDLDQKISKQLDAVMHHPEFQKVESLWRGTWFVVQRTDFRKNVRIELLDISKEHLRQDFDDSPEIIQSGLYRHTYTGSLPVLNISPRHRMKPVTKYGWSRVWRCWPAVARTPFTRTRQCRKSWRRYYASGTRCAVRTSCLTSKANTRPVNR